MPRRIVFVVVASVLASAHVAFAQQAEKLFRVGWIAWSEPSAPGNRALYDAFFRALREGGFEEGRNVVVERKYLGTHQDQVAAAAAEFVSKKVDLIVASGDAAAHAAKAATRSIPIVFVGANYPERTGLVANLARPEGNVTGISAIFSGGGGGIQQIIKEFVPERSRVAVLFDSRNGGSAAAFKSQVAVAPTLGHTLIPVDVRSDAELEKGLERVLRERADVIATHPVVADYGNRIAEFATRHRLPIFDGGGAFVSYGAVYSAAFDWRHVLHRGGVYVARILKGARPSDLPVEQASRIIVVVNLKAAKALGLAIPQSVLLRPDQVIE